MIVYELICNVQGFIFLLDKKLIQEKKITSL